MGRRFAIAAVVVVCWAVHACSGVEAGTEGWACPNDNNCRPALYCKDGECAPRPRDAGVVGPRDGGVRDAGVRDAGEVRDAGPRDAGPRDAGCFTPAQLGEIQRRVFTPSCNQANCHGAAAAAGIRLDTPVAQLRTTLLGPSVAQGAPEPNIVVPGDLAQSRLITIIEQRNPGGGGGPMPPDRMIAPCDIEAIRQWVVDGALEN